MALEHNFLGTWEILKCTFEGNQETSGLEGIKFRLDDIGDITWYNDLISPIPQTKDCDTCCDSASVLFSCETFDVNEANPRLIFGAFAGHSIEFKTNTLAPSEVLILDCENWYTLHCRRLKEDQAVDQEKEFSFADAFQEKYFSDVVISSSDGLEYNVHSIILRLNGFDCSMCSSTNNTATSTTTANLKQIKHKEYMSSANTIKIAITIPNPDSCADNKNLPKLNLSPIYLQPPSLSAAKDNLAVHKMSLLSSSFNCLNATSKCDNEIQETLKKYPTSSSDSNLQSNLNCKNIFNFSNDIFLNPPSEMVCSNRKPPLSPYRARSPSPFPSSLDTPPSSPLTPVAVLNNLPSFMLSPLLHWLYTESLLPNMEEDACEKLINFAETQPSLIKIVEPCRKYLILIRLKKFVIDITMDIHDIVNKIIQKINPIDISHQPANLFNVFTECLKEGAIGCAKILQFCNIFIKDAAEISRNQKNEIIKYIRTRIPIFMSQIHQLLKNILNVLTSLSQDEKIELITYLVPEIESSFTILTSVVEEIKISLEKMCKDLKCSHLDLSMKNENDMPYKICSNQELQENTNLFSRNRLRLYDIPAEKRFISAENDLKFVLYMYEVRKMRDIYGRISIALDVVKEKKLAFCEMKFLDKTSTINQNLEQLILDIPSHILIIENISDRLDDKIGWKEFKFCFKLATSQINGVIIKLMDHKPALCDSINQICRLVKKDEFTRSLTDLGLLEQSNEFKSSDENNRDLIDYKSVKLNLIKNLCEPPNVVNSTLSKNALRLLHSGQLADMEFQICFSSNSLQCPGNGFDLKPSQIHTFRAHRVVLSARCEWFKKAFLSGMLETITRKIIISDTSPVIFRRLLLYLYGAPIDKTVGAEQICELMLLADRYSVDDLKELCENTLNALIDEDSVVCLLGIADRYLAAVLKSKCLSFLSQHPSLTKLDMFKELPKSIQHEVQDLIHWYGRVPEPWNDGLRHSLKTSAKPRSRSRKSSPSYI